MVAPVKGLHGCTRQVRATPQGFADKCLKMKRYSSSSSSLSFGSHELHTLQARPSAAIIHVHPQLESKHAHLARTLNRRAQSLAGTACLGACIAVA